MPTKSWLVWLVALLFRPDYDDDDDDDDDDDYNDVDDDNAQVGEEVVWDRCHLNVTTIIKNQSAMEKLRSQESSSPPPSSSSSSLSSLS